MSLSKWYSPIVTERALEKPKRKKKGKGRTAGDWCWRSREETERSIDISLPSFWFRRLLCRHARVITNRAINSLPRSSEILLVITSDMMALSFEGWSCLSSSDVLVAVLLTHAAVLDNFVISKLGLLKQNSKRTKCNWQQLLSSWQKLRRKRRSRRSRSAESK